MSSLIVLLWPSSLPPKKFRLKSLTEELQQALMQVGSAVYSQAGASTNNSSNYTGSTNVDSSDDFIDADFVENK